MRRLIPVAVIAAILGLVGWRALRPTPVTVAEVTRGPAIEAVYATGSVEADPRVVVKARVPGTIAELLVREGERVKSGQLLSRIDNKSLRFDLERTRADVRASSLKTSTASPQLATLRSQRASIAADLQLAEVDLRRAEELTKKGALAQADLDARRQRVEKLRAELAAAEARVAATEIDLRAERERTGAISASIGAQVADTEIRAPMDGTIIRRRVELGEVVAVNQPLFTVGNTDHLILEVKIDEADVGRVRVGQEVLVDLYAFANKNVTGRVSEILPDADRDTKTFLGKIELVTPPAGLRSGMSTEVNIVTERHPDALLVPAGAVQGGRAFVVEDGRARARTVALGLVDPRNVEVRSGLRLGERVILVGPRDLKDGARVAARTVEEGGERPPAPERQPSSQLTPR
jgi:multidrug efflux pump subunit AcrA (membrane-fusion protein)